MKKKEIDLIKLTIAEDGEVFTRVYKPLRDDLGNTQLRRVLGYMDKVAQIIADSINELEGENKNE